MHQARLGLTEEQHALLLGVDITKTNWPMMAGNFARREYIFEGDKLIYDAARKARNEFEHGTADLGNVRQTADEVTRELFELVRSAVLSLVPSLDQTVCDAIMSKRPVDVSRAPRLLRRTGLRVPASPAAWGRPISQRVLDDLAQRLDRLGPARVPPGPHALWKRLHRDISSGGPQPVPFGEPGLAAAAG